jgi:hypothetical protein
MNGTMNGGLSGSSNSVPGKMGTALNFDGVNDNITLPTNSIIQPTSAITVAVWVKADTFTLWDSPIGNTDNPWNTGYGFFHNGTNTMSFFVNGYSANVATVPFTDTTGWHHLVGTWDGATVKIYLDGVVSSVTDNYAGTITYNDTNYIGSIESSTWAWDGYIDDVRIYNRALSDVEVRNLYFATGGQ